MENSLEKLEEEYNLLDKTRDHITEKMICIKGTIESIKFAKRGK